MAFIDDIKQRAKQDIKTIILPEAQDIRILEATQKILKEGYAKIILLGKKEEIEKMAKENNVNIEGAEIIDPVNSENYSKYVELLYNLRKEKGMTQEKAKECIMEHFKSRNLSTS